MKTKNKLKLARIFLLGFSEFKSNCGLTWRNPETPQSVAYDSGGNWRTKSHSEFLNRNMKKKPTPKARELHAKMAKKVSIFHPATKTFANA